MLQWVEPMPSLIGVNSKVFTSRTLLVFCQIKFQNYNFIEREKWMKGCALEKWESTLNLRSCPWTRCTSSHRSFFYNQLFPWYKFILYLRSGLFAIVVLTMFSFKYHVLCKFKHLSSIEQYPSSTSSLICRRVLPPGISRLSWNCIISYEFFIKYYILTDYNFSWARSY